MTQDVFLQPTQYYKRDLNHVSHYIKQMGYYISKMKGMCVEEARKKVREVVKKKIVNPTVVYYERRENLDKHKASTSLLGYLQDTFSKDEILTPTFTTYINPNIFTSPFPEFMIENKDLRATYKKKEKEEKMKKNYVMAVFYNKEQGNSKTYNNAGSGCFGSKGSILFNPTGHSTLTSTVRSETSVSNASNERLLEGNRHYRDCSVILHNLISICSDFDRDLTRQVVDKYRLAIPTAQDVIDVIERSYKLYAYDRNELNRRIVPFVNKLDDLERAAFVYIGDLYHLNKYNTSFVMGLLDSISCRSEKTMDVDKPESFMHTFDETIANHVQQIFCDHIKGVSKDDYTKVFDKPLLISMYWTAHDIQANLSNHADFIRAFFLTKHVPPSTAFIYDQTRRAIVGSDTDATMFSVDTLVKKRFGSLYFSTETKAFGSSVSLFTTKIIAHQLAMLSANLGVIDKYLFVMSMKPEFSFPVFAQTPVAKHYYTFATVQEGIHYDESKYKFEEKGVHMRNSAVPAELRDSGVKQMRKILLDLYANKPLVVSDVLDEVVATEKEVKRSLLASETTYFKIADVKTANSYNTPPNVSNYKFYTLWREVFEPHYGSIEEPNFIAVKVPLALNNTLDLKRWIESIENKDIAYKMNKWLIANNRKDFRTIMLNAAYIQSYGIPKELAMVLDYKRVILDLTISRRMISSSLGAYPKPKMTISEMATGEI